MTLLEILCLGSSFFSDLVCVLFCFPSEMEVTWRFWSSDGACVIRSWIPILLGLHLQVWRASTCPEACRCDRTFVYCNDRSLTSVPAGVGEGYQTLYLHNNQISNAGFPLEFHYATSVETVYLYGNQLEEFPFNLPRNVRVLHLQENNIQTISRAALAQLLQLEELHLDDNSISTVGVEEGAFRGALSLKMLFLTKNHLSSVPIGLPDDLKELRLDENRIALVAEETFQNVTYLERLLLDGNLLTDDGISPGAFQDLVALRELSLARNSLTYPPPFLPRGELVKLNLQENQLTQIPADVFVGMHKLERLDVSNNQLESLPRGVFRGLGGLRQLSVRNNPWQCDCSMQWVVSWLKSLPASLNVRGFMCHRPERFRGVVIRELNADLAKCPLPTSPANDVPEPSCPPTKSSQDIPGTPHQAYTTREDGLRTKHPLRVTFNILNGSAIHVSWVASFPVSAYRVTWARMGPSLTGDTVRERIVGAGHRGIRLSNLEPKSTYRICVIPLDAFNNYRPKDDTVCTEAVTTATIFSPDTNNNRRRSGPEPALQKESGSPLLLAGLTGGAVVMVLVVLLGVFCWHSHKRSWSRWQYNRGRRKDDCGQAGINSDGSLLQMAETGFQIVSLNNVRPVYAPNGGLGCRSGPPQKHSAVYCRNHVQDDDFCHS